MTSDASKTQFNEQIQHICEQTGVAKYDAFPRWICQNILGISDEGKIDEVVSIGGKNDYGIDIFHADDNGDVTEQYICWIQTKFSEDLNHIVNREEIESFVSTLAYLTDCPKQANLTFKQKSTEFIMMERQYPRIRKRMIFAVTGRLNEQAQELVNDPKWKKERLGNDPNIDLEILDLDGILSRMTIPHTPPLKIKFDGDIITRTSEITKKQSLIGHINAKDLVKITKDYKEMIFLENPRQTLGSSAPTHKAILNTLQDKLARSDFWKLNNGITATCTNFSATEDSRTYKVDNFKVVNGRQTTYTLENSTYPIDDVFLLLTIHETVDDIERNRISEATNTQNPIKPADLVTNYPEMTELMLQCKNKFNNFYFERQSKGFGAAKKSTRSRVTSRRILDKSAVARAYCAYSLDPNEAMMSDKVLFSVASDDSYYYKIFKNRKIEELIVPHIFMQMLDALHRRWCKELSSNQSDEISRKKGIISKDIVKYYILRFIYESMIGIDDKNRRQIKDKMIDKFSNLKKNDPTPDLFLSIAEAAYDVFMKSFNLNRHETWPESLLKKIKEGGHEGDMPNPYDIMYVLKQKGARLLPPILDSRKFIIKQTEDSVQTKLLELGAS